MVKERNLTEFENNCLGWRDALYVGRQSYVVAPRWNKPRNIPRRHNLGDSNFHIQCFTVYCAQNPLNVSECARMIKSFGRLNVLISSERYCKLLLTGSRMMCVSAAACSGSVQFCLSVCRSCKPLPHGALQINPYPTAFPYGNGMVLHFYQQQESSTTKTVHKVINKGLKTYVLSLHTGENFH